MCPEKHGTTVDAVTEGYDLHRLHTWYLLVCTVCEVGSRAKVADIIHELIGLIFFSHPSRVSLFHFLLH
jgi:hypothetical protein